MSYERNSDSPLGIHIPLGFGLKKQYTTAILQLNLC